MGQLTATARFLTSADDSSRGRWVDFMYLRDRYTSVPEKSDTEKPKAETTTKTTDNA